MRHAGAVTTSTLLATDVVALRLPLGAVLHGPTITRLPARRGRLGWSCVRLPGGGFRRAEQGPCGPLVLEVQPSPGGTSFAVWGDRRTPEDAVEAALRAARAWAGHDVDLDGVAELVADHPVLGRLALHLDTLRLSRLPRAAEAFGRAVLGQLVQGAEAARSTAQLLGLLGTPAPGGMTAWPTRQALGSTPAWTLRRCGISLRGAGALHAFCVAEPTLEALARRRDWAALDRALRRLPGCGAWTSAETRLALGDPDAVSVGDYHLPRLVGWVLGGGDADATDDAMLELLAPFAPHRGRVVRMVEIALRRKLVPGPPRRGPHAALSAHRYW